MFTTDIATDVRMAPWRVAALAREYRSSASFPLVVENRCVAVLTAYASEPGFFDEEEVELFDGLAADLSAVMSALSCTALAARCWCCRLAHRLCPSASPSARGATRNRQLRLVEDDHD